MCIAFSQNRPVGEFSIEMVGETLADIGGVADLPWLQSKPYEVNATVTLGNSDAALVLDVAEAGRNKATGHKTLDYGSVPMQAQLGFDAPQLRLDEFINKEALTAPETSTRARKPLTESDRTDDTLWQERIGSPDWLSKLMAASIGVSMWMWPMVSGHLRPSCYPDHSRSDVRG